MLWGYIRRGMAERLWRQWLHGALRCALEPIRVVARMIRSHWNGVINAATSDITNAHVRVSQLAHSTDQKARLWLSQSIALPRSGTCQQL
jgi:hypothetical protein